MVKASGPTATHAKDDSTGDRAGVADHDRVVAIELRVVNLPKFKPFKVAYGTIADPRLFVSITSESGHVGWGDTGHMIPGYSPSGEMWETALVRGELIASLTIGQDPFQIGPLHAAWDAALASNEQVKCAFDLALYDLAARIRGCSISDLLGGAFVSTFNVEMNIMIGSKEEVVADAGRALNLGVRTLGIKAGRPASPSIQHDVDMFRAIREAHGDDFDMWVDFNTGSNRQEAVSAIKALEPFGVGQAEQPVAAWDLQGMRYIVDRVATPVVADESVHGAPSVLEIAQKGAADIIHSKMPKEAGIYGALKIAAVCEALNMPLTMAGLGLSTYSQGALMHFLATQPICHHYSHKLRAGSLIYSDDIVAGSPPLVDGAFRLPRGVGTGLEMDVEKLRSMTVNEAVVTCG